MTYSKMKTGEFGLDFKVVDKNRGVLVKTMRVSCVQIEIKMKKNKKKNSLNCQATGCEFYKSLRGPQGHFLALGRMTYSHLPNRIFI